MTLPVPALTAPHKPAKLRSAETVLDNGLTVVAVRKPGVPLVEVRLRVPFLSGKPAHPAQSALLAESILTGALRLANAVRALADEHEFIATDIAEAIAATQAPVGADDVEPIREQATGLLGRLVRHRQRGADLIYEAYATDIGGGD